MNYVRCALRTANMPEAYWVSAMADVTTKHNLVIHETTDLCPVNVRTGRREALTKLFTFGKLWWTPRLPGGQKMGDRGWKARYMGI